MLSKRALLLGATITVLTIAGCAQFRAAANRPDPAPEGPTDGNIAAMLLAANNTDISYAKLAPARASSPAIKDFARRMITDHAAVNTAITELIARTDIKPEENTQSLDFRDESTTKRDLLRQLEGHAFDSTYIVNEIDYHTRLLRTLDVVLIPKAQDGQLRQVLVSVRPAIVAHLTHAHQVQASLR
jgi:putative membrane protein